MKLNERISVRNYSRVSDGYGGWNNTEGTPTKYWCDIKHITGDSSGVDGKMDRTLAIEVTMRYKSAESLSIGDVFDYRGKEYRIDSKIESELKHFVKLTASSD